MKDKIVCVEWDDASFNQGYYDKKDMTEFNPIKTHSTGFVVKSNKKVISISHDRFYTAEGKIDSDRHITTIPRGMIKHITVLKGEDYATEKRK